MKLNLKKISSFFLSHLQTFGYILGFIILVVGVVAFVVPQYNNVQKLGGINYSQKKSILESENAYLKKLQDLRSSLNNVPQADIDRLSLIIPKGKDIPGIFKQMEKFAKAVDMKLLSVSVADGGLLSSSITNNTIPSKVHTLQISVSLEGTLNYKLMKNFLTQLSKQAPVLDMNNISYTAQSGAAPTSYSFVFHSYYIE
jgi:hypothetical protein